MLLHSSLLCALFLAPQHPSSEGDDDGPRLVIRDASNEGAEAIARIKAAPGVEVTLFAAEPMVANPVALYIADDEGVYVVETFRSESGVTDMREHMDWLD